MTDEVLFKLVDELKEAKNIIVESDIKRRILQMLVNEFDLIYVAKQSYEKYRKWAYGITLKEFREEVEKLGLTIEETDSFDWNIKFRGCKVATIDPIYECTMQTSTTFYALSFKYELFELLTNLAYTCREDRHLEDYFEDWQYEE